MEEDNTKLIQKYKHDLEMYNEQLGQQIQECKAALQYGSHIEIYDTGCEIHSQISLPEKPVLGTASFTPNKTPQYHLELALGKMDTFDQGQASTDQDGSPTTHTMWVCDSENNIMELVSGQLTQRFSTKETPRCICVTASNHVIVGMTNNISKFTTQGQMVLTTSSLVYTPYRISECRVTHNVAVIDRSNRVDGGDGIHHAIVMDTDFKELFVYRGDIPSTYKQSSHKGAEPFYPWGVVYDSVGNIIIGDCINNRVLLISGRGEFLRIIHTDKHCTWAVGVDREDVMWSVFGGCIVKLLQYSSVTPVTELVSIVTMTTQNQTNKTDHNKQSVIILP